MKAKTSITRSILPLLCLCISLGILVDGSRSPASGDAFTMESYTQAPPFVAREYAPNVIFALDISGSMKNCAFTDTEGGTTTSWKAGRSQGPHDDFNPNENYYGYFDDADYVYDYTDNFFKKDVNGDWDGNFLNWLSMRRIDVARKVMVGGKVSVKTLDQDAGTIVPINRNKAKQWANWQDNWDGWYVKEGQHEPYDYEYEKVLDVDSTDDNPYTPAPFTKDTVFLVSEGKLIPQITSAGNVIQLGPEVEMGQVTMSWDETEQGWYWVPFANTYNQPRVVVKGVTFNGSHQMADCRIQICDAGQNPVAFPFSAAAGFKVRLQEWDYLDGNHTTETFSYLVVESANDFGIDRGIIEVTDDDGEVWKFMADINAQDAGTTQCGLYSDAGTTPQDVVWNTVLGEKPIVFTGVATWDSAGDTDALVTRNRFNGGNYQVDVTIQEQEDNDGGSHCTHSSTEQIHAIALIPPNGATTTISSGTFTYNGITTTIQAGVEEGVDEGWETITYSASHAFSETPMFMADMQTTNGGDPASIRVGGSSQTNDAAAIKLKIEEEKSSDSETGHADEDVGWIAVEAKTGFRIRVGDQTEPTGIIQEIAGKMRIGLAVYNYDHDKNPTSIYTGNKVHGGNLNPCYPDVTKPADQRTNYDICLSTGVHDPIENIYRGIEEHPLIWGTTPIAETLYEIMQYIQQADVNGDGHYNDHSTAPTYPAGATDDPYYYASAGENLECVKTFVLHFNDGAPYLDWDDPATTGAPDETHPAVGDADSDGNWGPYTGNARQGEQLDDMAYYIRNNDMRDDLDSHQDIISYYVYAALGEGEQFNDFSRRIREAAVNGGFVDLDNDHTPDPQHPSNINDYIQAGSCTQNEWDKDADCDPDTFYQASNGYQLVQELRAAFQSILQRTASGTAASVISNSRSGEGAIYQSVFFPKLNDLLGNEAEWLGQVHGLLVDAYGNMREDTNQNGQLDLAVDKFIAFDPVDGLTVYKYEDTNGDGRLDDSEKATPSETGVFMDIKFLWSSTGWLNEVADATLQRTYDATAQERCVFTFVDLDGDMVVDANEKEVSGEPLGFTTANVDTIKPYLHLFTPFNSPPGGFDEVVEAEKQINFIRGADQAGMRSRQIDYDGDNTVETWRMGDAVHSTPTTVGRPAEDYDLIYKDLSYQSFFIKYKNRRNVVYVGANDGMLHAINAGFYDRGYKRFDLQSVAGSETAYPLGAEMWAYVPHNLLPHLYWLTLPEYSHIYYVDMKPKVFDAKIFTADSTHPNGWGTVLVAGMRFGGGKIRTDKNHDGTYDAGTDEEMMSAYIILDITDPESPPQVLAEITFADLGYTTSYPTAIVMDPKDTSAGGNKWYLVLGSGPIGANGADTTALEEGSSNQQAKIYIIDLKQLAQNQVLKDHSGAALPGAGAFQVLPDSNSFVSDLISVDLDLDYKTDALYFGTISGSAPSWGGKLRRIVIGDDFDFNNWDGDSTLMDASQPIAAAPTLARDPGGHTWIYFGTGRYMNTDDTLNTQQQSFYAVKESWDDADNDGLVDLGEDLTWDDWDPGDPLDILDVTDATVYEDGNTVTGVAGATDFDELLDLVDNKDGWKLDFSATGERNLGQAALLGDILTFTTYIPNDDPCQYEGYSKLYSLYYRTGTAFTKPVIGYGDGSVNEDGDTKDEIAKEISLGKGLTITPNIHTGREEGSKAFIQVSTGAIQVLEQTNPGVTKSGKTSWLEDEG